jgi:hypothetical protein
MDDELAAALLWIFVAVIVIYLIILAIPFILAGLAYYYMGRAFHQQLQRYQLTSKSRSALFGIGVGSTLLSGAVVHALAAHPFFIVPIAALIFLLASIAVLAAWGYAKLQPLLERDRTMGIQEDYFVGRLQKAGQAVADTRAEIDAIRQQAHPFLEEKARLSMVVRSLCTSDEARTWISLKERWAKEFQAFGDGELVGRLRSALEKVRILANRSESPTPDRKRATLQAALLRMEQLERAVGPIERAILAKERLLDARAREQIEAKQRLDVVKAERLEVHQAIADTRASRIILD